MADEHSDGLTRRAKTYQEHMQMIAVPTKTHSVIPFKSWACLADSVKQIYRQELHYLTNVCMKEWDQMRVGADNEDVPLEDIIHPTGAEAAIWHMEEVHRRTTSPDYLAKLWLADPMYHKFIDPIHPNCQNAST